MMVPHPIEADPSDNAVISYTWLTHGVFETTLTAEDEEGNSHSIEVSCANRHANCMVRFTTLVLQQ